MSFDGMNAESDEELLARFASGDQAAARVLTARLTPRVLGLAMRMLRDDAEAEDVAQESFFRLFGRELRGTPTGVRAWLFKTATHLVRDRHRVESNRRRLLEKNHEPSVTAESPDLHLERAERREQAREALDQLNPRDREVLMMRYSGFSYRDIAEAVGLEPGSVGTTLARAERRFARAVDAGSAQRRVEHRRTPARTDAVEESA